MRFLVAFRLPGMVRRVLGEGGLNAGGWGRLTSGCGRRKGGEAARRFAGEALASMALGLLVLVRRWPFLAPWLDRSGWPAASRRIPSASASPRPISGSRLPLVFATTMTALAGAILENARGRFLLAAFAPVAVNVVLVAVLLALQASEHRGRAAGRDPRRRRVAGLGGGAARHPASGRCCCGPDRPVFPWRLPRGRAPGLARGRPRLLAGMLKLGLPGLATAAAA